MSSERALRAVAERRDRLRARRGLAEEARVRLAAGVLWLVVGTAAVGGIVGLLRPAPAPSAARSPAGSPAGTVSEAWAAGGFGARAVAAYLASDDSSAFAGFMGETASSTEPGQGPVDAPTVAVTAVEWVAAGYWAVTVAAGEAGREGFWRIGVVASRNGRLVATGLPTPVSAPRVTERPELVSAWESPPSGDPVAETVTGWVAAYACGAGDVSRWLRPGLHLDAVHPPLCDEARLERWALRPEGEDRMTVATEAVLDPGAAERRVGFALVLERRGGRWEVAELLAAPPLSEEVRDR